MLAFVSRFDIVAGSAEDLQVTRGVLLSIEAHSGGCIHLMVLVALRFDTVKGQVFCGTALSALPAEFA